MTTTGVKNAGSMLNNLAASVTARAAGQTSEASFQNVWDSRTGKNDQSFAENSAKKTDVQDAKTEEPTKTKNVDNAEAGKDTVKESSNVDETKEVKDGKDSAADTEEAMEVLMTAAAQIVDVVTETFEISEDELNAILDDMGLTTMDLLDPQKLGEVILEAGGAQDSLALLTNEALYQDFNSVMDKLTEVLGSDSGVNNLNMEELKAAFEVQTAAPQIEKPEENVRAVEITVESETDSREADKLVTDESDSPGAEAMLERADQSRKISEQAGRNAEERNSEKHSKGDGQNTNLFLQNIRNDSLGITAEGTAQAASGAEVNTQDIMRQLMDYMKIQVKPDMSNLEMQLHPESLGTIRIQLASNGGSVTANFVTQNEAVKAALESQMVQLKESFVEQGIKVEAIEVTVQTHQFEQNLEQGQSNGRNTDNETAKSGRTRRIRLEGMLSEDELDEMENEDRIAAEMMEANGGTVDYTV